MKKYERKILSSPSELVTEGEFNFGSFDEAFHKVNMLDVNRLFHLPLARILKKLRLKEWQAFQLGNQRFFMLLAVYNAKSLAINQLIIFDRKTGKKYRYAKITPFWKAKIANSLFKTHSYFHSSAFRIDINNDLKNNEIKIHVTANMANLPNLDLQLTAHHGQIKPSVVCVPFGKNRAMYSHKALMSMHGTMSLDEEEISFETASSFAILDDHKGYYPFTMKYDWLTGVGYDSDNKLIGFNLTDNQSIDSERFNENNFWQSSGNITLPPVTFERPNGVENEWIISDKYERVRIHFFPESMETVQINAGLIRSDYYGPFGRIEGYFIDNEENKIELNQFYGMAEKKMIRT